MGSSHGQPNHFTVYFKLFNLEIQFEYIISTENYHTKLLKLLQNLINQHDYKYFIIQNVIIHADIGWPWDGPTLPGVNTEPSN